MEILFIVAHTGGGAILKGLASACRRQGLTYSIFFTGRGAEVLDQEGIEISAGAQEAIACEHAWQASFGDLSCPIEIGSQTDNTRLLANAKKVVSL